MKDEEDAERYLDPRQNPLILAHEEADDDDESLSDPLAGLGAEVLKDFVGSEGKRYIYPERFYAPDVTKEELMTLPPRLILTLDGDHVKIEHPHDDAIITAEEADLLRLAIEQKARGSAGDEAEKKRAEAEGLINKYLDPARNPMIRTGGE